MQHAYISNIRNEKVLATWFKKLALL